MSIEIVLITAALVIALVAKGRPKSILRTPFNFKWALVVALAGHLFIEFAPIDESLYDTVGFGVLMFTYIMLFTFCIANINLRGMWLVFIGLASNAFVTALNGTMPVTSAGDFTPRESIRYSAESSGDLVPFLGSMIPINAINVAISVGDIIFAIGMTVVLIGVSRKQSNDVIDLDQNIDEPTKSQEFDSSGEDDDRIVMETAMTDAALSKNVIMASTLRDNDEYIDIREDEPVVVASATSRDDDDTPQGSGAVAVLERVSDDDESFENDPDRELVDSTGERVQMRSSLKPQRSKNDAQALDKLLRKRSKRSRKKWQKTHGLSALPKPEELGYDENSMTIVDAAK